MVIFTVEGLEIFLAVEEIITKVVCSGGGKSWYGSFQFRGSQHEKVFVDSEGAAADSGGAFAYSGETIAKSGGIVCRFWWWSSMT